MYDPDHNELDGWLRQGAGLVQIEVLNGCISSRLGIRLDLLGEELRIYRPDGKLFVSYTELDQQVGQAQLQAETERLRANAVEQQLATERQRTEGLRAKLQALGIDPDTLT